MFEPFATPPTSTYIDRINPDSIFDMSYDNEFQSHLNNMGELLIISSDSKLGKTSLVSKYVAKNVTITGNDLNYLPMYEVIAEKMGIIVKEGTITNGTLGPISKGKTSKTYVSLKNLVIDNLKDHILIIDDIHQGNEEVIDYLAKELKFLITKVKVVVTSHPEEVNQLMHLNPDLNGRVHIMNIANWSNEDLIQLFKKGYKKEIPLDVLNYLVSKCIYSPYIMQRIGKLVIDLDLDVSIDIIDKCCKQIAKNVSYETTINKLPKMASSAKKYSIDGYNFDIISAILYTLTIDPLSNRYTTNEFIIKLEKNFGSDINIAAAYKRVISKFSDLNVKEFVLTNDVISVHDVTFIFYLKYNYFDC